MKITLINPPIEDFYVTGIRRQPLGLLYIASALIKGGFKPVLLNCHSGKKSVMELPAEFSYLKPYINNSDPGIRFPYKNYTHYGMSWQEIERQIKD
ncbi:MAG: radical SAM protein, partial [Spirochaetae bacterium HGW-Spirochaetae-5]